MELIQSHTNQSISPRSSLSYSHCSTQTHLQPLYLPSKCSSSPTMQALVPVAYLFIYLYLFVLFESREEKFFLPLIHPPIAVTACARPGQSQGVLNQVVFKIYSLLLEMCHGLEQWEFNDTFNSTDRTMDQVYFSVYQDSQSRFTVPMRSPYFLHHHTCSKHTKP